MSRSDDPIEGYIDTVDADSSDALEILEHGEIEVLGRMPWSSNGTWLCALSDGDATCRAIYKPATHERPLWDFPDGLWRREVATWELAKDLGWNLIPPTIERDGLLADLEAVGATVLANACGPRAAPRSS